MDRVLCTYALAPMLSGRRASKRAHGLEHTTFM
jgi:hypothetical protein